MCGRFTLANPERLARALLARIFPGGSFELPPGTRPRFNVAPSQPVLVLPNLAEPRLDTYRWGLIPPWADDEQIAYRTINARAEGLADKPAFRRAFRKRRCLVLADGFYEWKREGRSKWPMYIRRRDGEPFAFAGLWELWRPEGREPVRSCTIITTEPNALLAPIHERMPVILPAERCAQWLDPEPQQPEQLAQLLLPIDAELLEAYPVAKAVNSPDFDEPACIERVAAAPRQRNLFE